MSPTKPDLRKWPFNWLFSKDKFTSIDPILLVRQQLAKFILDLGTNLKISDRCIHTAVVYMHRFLMVHSHTSHQLLRVCQASIFLACKVEEIDRHVKDIYKCSAEILNIQTVESAEELCENDIVDHEDTLLSTLGFAITVRHPHEIIDQTIQKIRNQSQSLTTKSLDELKKTAHYLATESILLTPFCVKYSADLIACFCIQLAIEIEKTNSTPRFWFQSVDKSFTETQLQNIKHEFYVIYQKSPDKYRKFSASGHENKLYGILHDKASNYVDSLKGKSISSAINIETDSLTSSSPNTDKQKSLHVLPLSSTIPPPQPYQCSRDSIRKTGVIVSSTNQTSQSSQQLLQSVSNSKSEQPDDRTGSKRHCDSPNNSTEFYKRPKLSSQQREKK